MISLRLAKLTSPNQLKAPPHMISPIFLALCTWAMDYAQALMIELTPTPQLAHKPLASAVVRTGAEAQFITMDYGVIYEARRLGRKERLALRFTRMTEEL